MLSTLLLSAVATGGTLGASAPGPYPLIHSSPPTSSTYSSRSVCADNSEINVSILEVGGQFEIENLSIGKIRASEKHKNEWSMWLNAAMSNLRSISVQCADNGAVIFVTGGKSPRSSNNETVVVGWINQNLYRM